MKKILFCLTFLCLLSGAYAQSECCPQVFISKSSRPFACLETQKAAIVQSQFPGVDANAFIVSSQTYGYRGQMIKVLTRGAMFEPAFQLGLMIVVNDACEVVCNTTYQIDYRPSVGSTGILIVSSTCGDLIKASSTPTIIGPIINAPILSL